MKKKRRKKKNKLKIANIMFLISLIASLYLIYNILLLKNIENVIRIVLIIIIIGINFYFYRRSQVRRKNNRLFITVMTLFIISNILAGGVINKIYSSIDKINKDEITYSSYLIAMKYIAEPKMLSIPYFKICYHNRCISSYQFLELSNFYTPENFLKIIFHLFFSKSKTFFTPKI